MINKWMSREQWYNDTERGENEIPDDKTCPNATLCAINPTWTGVELNSDLRGNTPATNSLRHGTVGDSFLED